MLEILTSLVKHMFKFFLLFILSKGVASLIFNMILNDQMQLIKFVIL